MCVLLLQDRGFYLLINAFNQPEVEVIRGLLWSASIVYEHQSGGISLPHLEHKHTENTVDTLLLPYWCFYQNKANNFRQFSYIIDRDKMYSSINCDGNM